MNSFVKILNSMAKDNPSQLTPLASVQLIRFIKEILIKSEEDVVRL